MTKLHVLGVLVMISQLPVVAQPATNVVVKNGRKQFWFYHDHKPVLAVQNGNAWYAQVSEPKRFYRGFNFKRRRIV